MSDTFAAYLREHLTAAGITAKTLATRVGVGESAVSHWLAGQRVPRAITADKISTALQIDANDTRRAAGHPVLNIVLTDQQSTLRTDPNSPYHPLRQYLQSQLDLRGWRQTDLANRSGLSRQLVSNMLNDNRPRLGRMPDGDTLEALAAGLDVPLDVIRTAASRSLVNYVDDGTPLTIELTDTSTDELLGEIRRRLTATPSADDAALPTADRVNAIVTATRELLADLPADTPIGTHLAAALAELEAAALHENTPTRTEER